MRIPKLSRVAVLSMALGLAIPVGAQVLPIEPTIVDERPVVMTPFGAQEFAGSSMAGEVAIRVSMNDGLRTYRAWYGGRIYTAYEDASRPSARLAFDPAARRFQRVSPTIRVELHNFDSLDSIVRDHAALYGRAYPELGFALIRLGPGADPARVVELLDVDARVRDAHLQFEREPMLPMTAPIPGIPSGSSPTGTSAATGKFDPLKSHFVMLARPAFDADGFAITVTVQNVGAGRSEEATFVAELLRSVPDDSTMDEDDVTTFTIETKQWTFPAIDGKGATVSLPVSFETSELDAGETYFGALRLLEGTDGLDDAERLARRFSGFTLDKLNRVQRVCVEPGRGPAAGSPDPLLAQQWNLENTGQTGYAYSGGVSGEDLQMGDALIDGPTGDGVRVAVVDTGLEICHPELRGNIEVGASFNFNAIESLVALETHLLQGALETLEVSRPEPHDPFNFAPTGDHGTSVAGVVAAGADNGIGLRGVAPDVLLRGYNFLEADDDQAALIGSLGASSFLPNSSDVDIFNMSWGRYGETPVNLDPITEQVFVHGARTLRSGLGAIYVKSGGNGFRRCRSLQWPINSDVGCVSSNSDAIASLPYIIVVGAFNADGKRSSYSSAGPNLWVSAPGGEYGFSKPALLSVDQMGVERGLPVFLETLLGFDVSLGSETSVNPHGDYMAYTNGTSAAAPHVTGAVALLLEESPDLTWRDVKYILAKTARRIDPDIESVGLVVGTTARTLLFAWTTNAAGFAYHDWYGFGAVDVAAALAFLDDYTPDSLGEFRQSGWFEKSESLSIPDNDGGGATQSLTVSGLPEDANIEAVVVEIDVSHDFPNDLGIQLVSPQGTRAVINQVFNETLALENGNDPVQFKWRILANAFFGETPNGDWQIDVFDGAVFDTGSLEAWRLQFYYGTHPVEDDEGEGDDDSEPTTDSTT